MVGLSGVLLIVALVVMSGVIAYVGDIVGRRIGRKRLSLLRMRPRHTAVAISVLAGMTITLITLAVAMAVSRDVKDGFLRVEGMRRRQAELAQQLGQLKDHVAELERTREKVERGFGRRKAELDRMLEDANSELERTKEEYDDASEALKRAEEAFQRVALSATNLAREKADLQRDIETLRAQAAGDIALQRATPVVFEAGQPLEWQLIMGGRPKAEIRAELDSFVSRLDAWARAAGARPLAEAESAIIIQKPVRSPESPSVVWFGPEQVLDALAERIQGSSGGVIVRTFSVFNTHPGEPVRVDFELFRNQLVFRRGDQLAQAVVDGRLPEPTLMGALVALLRDQVGAQGRAHNIMPRRAAEGTEVFGTPRGAVGEMSYDKLFGVIERVRQIDGPAEVTAVAASDTWTIGPLEVDLLVASASSASPQ